MSAIAALRRVSQASGLRLTRSIHTGAAAAAEHKKTGPQTHLEVVLGDGHHGLREGYQYDFEHGPHYLDFSKIPNWQLKLNIFCTGVYAAGMGIPIFAVLWQQSKLVG